MNNIRSYALDTETIKLHCYNLICIFYANKEIQRQTDPVGEFPTSPAELQEQFFMRELTRLVLTIALSVRTIDDQFKMADQTSPQAIEYKERLAAANREYLARAGGSLKIRDVCNKIIHATSIELGTENAADKHEYDRIFDRIADLNLIAFNKKVESSYTPIAWSHLSGTIIVRGTDRDSNWRHEIDVTAFVAMIHLLFDDKIKSIDPRAI